MALVGRLGLAAAVLVASNWSHGAPSPSARIGLDERVEAQRRIEAAQWERRIWPADNPGPKPTLAEVLPDEAIRERVRQSLRKSNALETLWGRPLTTKQIQGELDRISRNTRDGAALQALFARLGHDPEIIAECLVRPILADRLLRSWFAHDERVHGPQRSRIDSQIAAAAGAGDADLAGLDGTRIETTYRHKSVDGSQSQSQSAERIVDLDISAWEQLQERIRPADPADPDGWSPMREDEESFFIERRVSSDSGRVQTQMIRWQKKSFDTWWDETSPSIELTLPDTVGPYILPSVSTVNCSNDTWRPTFWKGPIARSGHRAVWTGTEYIVWGGTCCNSTYPTTYSGGRYNPSLDAWTPMRQDVSTPEGRYDFSMIWTGTDMIMYGGAWILIHSWTLGSSYNPLTDTWTALPAAPNEASFQLQGHSAVWTGSEMIVWGGYHGSLGYTNTGARYSPASNTWTPTSTGAETPSARYHHTAVWAGGKMLVWGGDLSNSVFTNTGAAYDPAVDSWTTIPTAGAPSARRFHTAVWTGSEMIVWGGTIIGAPGVTNTGARFKLATNSWTALPTSGANPSAREFHTAVWTGAEMIVWGGTGGATGGRFRPSANSWFAMATVNSDPGGPAVWTGSEMLVWGGTGARYSPTTNTWVRFMAASGTGPPSERIGHSMTWTGAEVIIWSGESGNLLPLASGSRYDPMTDSWTPIPVTAETPSSRIVHSAIWTGTEVLVWGGQSPSQFLSSGGRYSPQLDSWSSSTSLVGAPSGRRDHTAVWTGKEMLVFGGRSGVFPYTYLSVGGRYDPSSDTWRAMSMVNAPSPRAYHVTAWTGSRMIVWGGGIENPSTTLDSGGVYDPASDTWTPVASAGAPPAARCFALAAWTGSLFLVWGGDDFCGSALYFNDGGAYDPIAGIWTPMAVDANTPSGRILSSSVWTGSELLVWGGIDASNSKYRQDGGRYNPASDSWLPISVTLSTPNPRNSHRAVWTGSEMMVWGGEPMWGVQFLDTGGLYCAGPCTTPAMVTELVLTAGDAGLSEIAWEETAAASSYDVVRGEISALRSSGGNFTTATTACLARRTPAPSIVDGSIPPAGDGYWYLARASNCGVGTYESGGPTQSGSRDAEIAASAAACP